MAQSVESRVDDGKVTGSNPRADISFLHQEKVVESVVALRIGTQLGSLAMR